jgi:hypothetical protein
LSGIAFERRFAAVVALNIQTESFVMSLLLKSCFDRGGSAATVTTNGKRVAGRGDKDDRGGLLGADETQIGQCSCSRLSRGSGPDQQSASGCRGCARRRGPDIVCDHFRVRAASPPHPPRSRLWANDRSTISARRRLACLPAPDPRRVRFA